MELTKNRVKYKNWTQLKIDENILEDMMLEQHEIVTNGIFGKKLYDFLPISICILNSENKIVYSNKTLHNLIESDEISILGKSIGNILGCINYNIDGGECGESKYCGACGALNAVVNAKQGNSTECNFKMIKKDNTKLNFRIWASPVQFENENFVMCALTDIGDEVRKNSLERIFFHDILNTAAAVKGYMELLQEADDDEVREFLGISMGLIHTLIDEIEGQRLLLVSEKNEMSIEIQPFSTIELLLDIKTLYESHEVAEGKTIKIDDDSVRTMMSSDKRLLKRVIGNLVKNALEACNVGETVTLNCTKKDNSLEFHVCNPNYIHQNIQIQIFHRPFSTKGSGRGVGTHSVKLLTEKYLKGKVSFSSSLEEGTRFTTVFPVEYNIRNN